MTDTDALERLMNESRCWWEWAEGRNRYVERLEREVDEARRDKDGAYSERDKLVCLLSSVFPSWLERHPDEDETWDDDWRWIVFIELPTGQATWHIHDSELEWFGHLSRSGAHRWDGHTTEEKYERVLAAVRAALDAARGVESK